MTLINGSGSIGVVIDYFTYNVTGSLFLSLISVIVVLFAISFMFRLPVEWTALFIFPLVIAIAAFTSNFMPLLIAFIFYLAVLMAKNFFFK